MMIGLYGVSRVRTRCVASFEWRSSSVTRLRVILPCFSKELELCMRTWCMYRGLLLCRRKSVKMQLHCCNNIIK